MTRVRILFVAGLVALLAACHPTRGEREVVRRWLLCEECIEGELEAVVPLGDRVTGMLADALLKGPPAPNREHIRRQAESRSDRAPPTVVSRADFIDHYESNYVASYQAHAAIALGRIGTPKARAALRQALQRDSTFRYDVRRELADAAPLLLDTLAGGNQAAPRDSVVRVRPAVRVRDSVTGQALANIAVRFTVDSGGGRIADTLRRTDPTGVAAVPWTLGPGPDSLNVLRAEAFNRSVSFRATGHGLTPRLAFAAQPTGGKVGQPLVPGLKVLVLDAWDQLDTTFNGTALAAMGPSGAAIILVSGPIVKGVVDLPSLVPNFPATGAVIRVRAAGATAVVSRPFAVAP